MATLEHAFKAEIQAIRRTILGADARVAEGIKWKAPSFRIAEYFATLNLREKRGVGVILHRGAKVRDDSIEASRIDDPQQLLQWLAHDRAMVVFKDSGELSSKQAAFEAIIRQWIAQL